MPCQNRKWPRSLFRPVPARSWKERSGPGWDQDGMAPTSGPGWIRNAGKQSTWRIWTGPLRTRDGTWTGLGPDPCEGLDGTPRDSNRLLGLSDKIRTSSTTTRDRNLQFRGAVSTGGSPLVFLFFLQYLCVQFSKTGPIKSGESSEKSSGENRVKSCHVCGCHGPFFSALTKRQPSNLLLCFQVCFK